MIVYYRYFWTCYRLYFIQNYKTMKKHWIYLLLLAGLLTNYSCDNNSNTTANKNEDFSESMEMTQKKIYFQIPTPMELLMFVKDDHIKFNKSLTHSIEKANQYVSRKSKALNMGIYSCDLAYSTVFNQNQETVKLFAAVKNMAEQLGLTEGFDPSILERIENNINNSDSLLVITKQSYNKSINFLQANGQLNILPYIMYGGWLESVYITCNSLDNFPKEGVLAERITDQAILAENLIEFFENIKKDDKGADKIINNLNSILSIYGTESQLNKDSFLELKSKIEPLRNEITK